MKQFSILLFFAALFLSASLQGQSKKIWLKYADEAFRKKDYPTAIAYYTQVLDDSTVLNEMVLPYEVQMVNLKLKSLKNDSLKTPVADTKHSKSQQKEIHKSDYINHKLAHAYRLNYDYVTAMEKFRIVVGNGSYPDDVYYYALALMQVRKYDEAMLVFETYVARAEGKDSLKNLIQRQVASCYFALDTASFKRKVHVKSMDSLVFNRGTSNFAPMYWGGSKRLLFTSARPGGVLIDPEKQESRYLCDLYYSEQSDTGWSKPSNLGRPVNTGLHEGAGVFSADNILFFTRWSDAVKNEAFIYMAKMKDGYFYEAYKLNATVNVPGYKAIHPFVSFDGTKLYFSSNKPGGKGGMDLYVCGIDENGWTGTAKNLGSLNTPGDEVTPFFHTISNTLFFSSNGLTGVGGLDVYKSQLSSEDSVYSQPKNMGRPINSSKDDAYFILDRMQSQGYLASDRKDCPNGNCYQLYEFNNDPIALDVQGYVFDSETNDPIPGALVTIRDVHNDQEPIFLVTNDKGFYSSPLLGEMEYFIKAQKKGYFADASSISTKDLTESAHFEKDFYLGKIPLTDIVIEGIEYDLNKATIRPKSKEILDKVYQMLSVNDNIIVEVNAHTDSRGNDKYNLRLSQARAQSCVDYLVSKGIARYRLIPKGYGETLPIISDEEIAKLVPKSDAFEAAHQKNRRTAFRVVKEAAPGDK